MSPVEQRITFFLESPCCSPFKFFVLSYCMSLRSEFRVGCPLRFPHKTMFGSSLPPVVCRRAHVLIALFVFVCREDHVLIALFVFVCRRIMS